MKTVLAFMWTNPFWVCAPFRGALHKYVDVTDMRINARRKKAAEKMLKALKSPSLTS
jgi:hypothetical protein